MDASKTAVAENADDFAGLNGFSEFFDNGIRIGQVEGRFAELLEFSDQAVGIEAFFGTKLLETRDLGDDDAIGQGERISKFLLKDISAGGV